MLLVHLSVVVTVQKALLATFFRVGAIKDLWFVG